MISIGHLAATAGEVVLASSGSDGDGGNIAFLFLFSGFVFYGLMFLRYRNVHQRHKHESETRSEMHNLRVQDEYVRSLKGVSNSRMSGANNTSVRGKLSAFF